MLSRVFLVMISLNRQVAVSGDDSKDGIAASETTPSLEASILMDDIMNNGMTFCSIM